MNQDIVNLFGTGTTLDVSTPSNPVLRIPFNAVSAAANWTTPPTSGTDSAEKWLAAIILQAKAHLATITNDSNDISIDNPFKSTTTRNNVDKVGFSYNLTIYQPDLNGSAPDPDQV